MAEVVGLIASVATLLHLARKVQEYAHDAYAAKAQHEELSRTLATFQTKVELLGKHAERAFKHPKDERFEALRLVLQSSTVLDSSGENLDLIPSAEVLAL